ncbi:hypothetical protein FAGKG844_560017 [Frankia sp. AgKG'84/4]
MSGRSWRRRPGTGPTKRPAAIAASPSTRANQTPSPLERPAAAEPEWSGGRLLAVPGRGLLAIAGLLLAVTTALRRLAVTRLLLTITTTGGRLTVARLLAVPAAGGRLAVTTALRRLAVATALRRLAVTRLLLAISATGGRLAIARLLLAVPAGVARRGLLAVRLAVGRLAGLPVGRRAGATRTAAAGDGRSGREGGQHAEDGLHDRGDQRQIEAHARAGVGPGRHIREPEPPNEQEQRGERRDPRQRPQPRDRTDVRDGEVRKNPRGQQAGDRHDQQHREPGVEAEPPAVTVRARGATEKRDAHRVPRQEAHDEHDRTGGDHPDVIGRNVTTADLRHDGNPTSSGRSADRHHVPTRRGRSVTVDGR